MADSAKKPKPQAGVGRLSGTNIANTPPTTSTKTPPRNSPNPVIGASATPTRQTSIRAANPRPLSAKAAVRKPGGPSSLANSVSTPDEDAEQDARAETLALVEDLKERLKKAEEALEEYRKQVEVFQARLDESHKEQGQLEDKAHEDDERLESLKNEKRELTKQKRELESIYEAERASWMKEKENADVREAGLQEALLRFKETVAAKEARNLDVDNRPGLSRTCTSIIHASCIACAN